MFTQILKFSEKCLRNEFRLCSDRFSSEYVLFCWFSVGNLVELRLSMGPTASCRSGPTCGKCHYFSHRFFDLVFYWFLVDFGTYFGFSFDDLSMFLHYFFEHGFYIDFILIFNGLLDRCNLQNHGFTAVKQWFLHNQHSAKTSNKSLILGLIVHPFSTTFA